MNFYMKFKHDTRLIATYSFTFVPVMLMDKTFEI